MAESRSAHRGSKSRRKPRSDSEPSPQAYLDEASKHLVQSSPELALPLAQFGLFLIQAPASIPKPAALPALNLIAIINLELGRPARARDFLLQCVELDPAGQNIETEGGGAEKFLWLAQLCEEGGHTSIEWFEKGCVSLRREISIFETYLETITGPDSLEDEVVDRRQKLSTALCGMVEIWMTDLSFEDKAEGECERLITEAMLVSKEDVEVLQTLASVRISQVRMGEAREALKRSMKLWEEGGKDVPAFAARISLARLCMEVGMLEEARGVLERLVGEDDESVEAWYLGGWCLFLMGKGEQNENKDGADGEQRDGESIKMLRSSRMWLRKSLGLYHTLEYEDNKLRDHAVELVEGLDGKLGPEEDAEGEGDEEGEWEDEGSGSEDEDQEMAEA